MFLAREVTLPVEVIVHLDRAEVGFFDEMIKAADNLAVCTCLDSFEARLKLSTTSGLKNELLEFLEGAKSELSGLEVIEILE